MTLQNELRRGPVRLLRAFACAVAAALFAAPPAFGQDNGANDPSATRPQTQSPFWGDDYLRDRGYGDRGRNRHYDRYEDDERTFPESFPVDLAALVAPARSRFMALKYSYTTAQRQLGRRIDELRSDFEQSEDYRALVAERDLLQRQVEESRRAALEPLEDDDRYRALVALERQLEMQIGEEHRAPDRDMSQIRAMSELALDYSRERRALEEEQLARGATLTAAPTRLREITDELRDMEDRWDRELRNNQQLVALRDQIQQLRIEYLAAGGFYDSAVRAADIATDFAYFNSVMQSDLLSYSPYGYGHSYPYGYGGFGGFGGKHFGGVIIGGITFPDSGTGPIRLRPVLFPTPILSNTWRGVNQTPPGPVPTGNEAPPIPLPDEQ